MNSRTPPPIAAVAPKRRHGPSMKCVHVWLQTMFIDSTLRQYWQHLLMLTSFLLPPDSKCIHRVPSFILKLTHTVTTKRFSKYFHTHQMCCFLGCWSLRDLLITLCRLDFNHFEMAPHLLHSVKCCRCCCWFFHSNTILTTRWQWF